MEPEDEAFLIPLMGRRQRFVIVYLVLICLVSLTLFIFYWFQPEHIVTWSKFITNTFLLLWINLLPGYFFYFVFRMSHVNPEIEIPENWRVAMITTKAPSELFSIVKTTLLAMKGQKFPHHT